MCMTVIKIVSLNWLNGKVSDMSHHYSILFVQQGGAEFVVFEEKIFSNLIKLETEWI